jgi:hypothetical protein
LLAGLHPGWLLAGWAWLLWAWRLRANAGVMAAAAGSKAPAGQVTSMAPAAQHRLCRPPARPAQVLGRHRLPRAARHPRADGGQPAPQRPPAAACVAACCTQAPAAGPPWWNAECVTKSCMADSFGRWRRRGCAPHTEAALHGHQPTVCIGKSGTGLCPGQPHTSQVPAPRTAAPVCHTRAGGQDAPQGRAGHHRGPQLQEGRQVEEPALQGAAGVQQCLHRGAEGWQSARQGGEQPAAGWAPVWVQEWALQGCWARAGCWLRRPRALSRCREGRGWVAAGVADRRSAAVVGRVELVRSGPKCPGLPQGMRSIIRACAATGTGAHYCRGAADYNRGVRGGQCSSVSAACTSSGSEGSPGPCQIELLHTVGHWM